MKPVTKKILLISGCCMGAGLLLTGAGIVSGGWPGFAITQNGIQSSASQSEPYVLEKTILENFSGINLRIDDEADIELLVSDNDNFYLEYTLYGNSGEPEYEIDNGTLNFHYAPGEDTGISLFGPGTYGRGTSPVVRLYIPESIQMSGVDIFSGYGDLTILGLNAGQADIRLDYGELYIENVSLDSGTFDLSAGDLEFSDSAVKTLTLMNEYGDCSLKGMHVESADLTLEAGDLVFDADGLKTLTGYSDYGDTSLTLYGSVEDYSFSLSTEYGEISVPETSPGRLVSGDSLEMTYDYQSDGNKKVEFSASSGDIEVDLN